jgi:type I restriction enzyme R subunit
LRAFLKKQKVTKGYLDKAVAELKKVAGNQVKSLYDVNEEVYSLLRYGVKVKRSVGDTYKTIWLIDWENPENNHFAIAEEVSVRGLHNKRPDIVLYVNGIAMGVLELKRCTVSLAEGIRQNLDNQTPLFIQSFFNTIQLVMAGNETEGMKYGVIETPEKYYLSWHEPSELENPLDRQLLQMCNKARFLEIIHDFMVFDSGVKKICRHSQFFAVKASQESLKQREGGIIWHAQGSGKSLIMVWLTKWIREHFPESRILIITDRTELDQQIEGIYKNVHEDLYRCKSGADLIEKLNDNLPSLLCSLIHKFANREESDVEGFMREIHLALPRGFKPKGDIIVYVDECHRTQSGDLHKAMKAILPDAIFIGFTGTPLLKTDKQKSIEVFGKYIHTYKFDEAVRDEVILDLRYEARDIDQAITSPERIDQWFEAKTRGLNDVAKGQLKRRWGTMQMVLSSRSRLEKIVADILLDMETKDRLISGRGNAMLVAGSIYEACIYYDLFVSAGFDKCAIVTSYGGGIDETKGEETGDGDTENQEKYAIYQKMLNGKPVEQFEREVKEKFVKTPAQMKLLIVVDKLLTGFDAPPATYMYIDKKMQDHGLFQAICRVNRLDDVDKEYGFIIDYKDLFQSLEHSVHEYTSGAFDAYEKEDVVGLLTDRLQKGKEHLEETREQVKALCEPVSPPKDTMDYINYFCGGALATGEQLEETEHKRIALYKHVVSLIRAYANIANELEEAGFSPEEIKKVKADVEYYEAVRTTIRLASGDYIDLKAYEPAMRHLIDTYIQAEDSKKISAFDDMTLLKLIVETGADAFDRLPEEVKAEKDAVAETIENNLRRKIIEESPVNPKYFEKMSHLLTELVIQRKQAAMAYKEYLIKVIELAKQVQDPGVSVDYPTPMDSSAKRALFDNLGGDVALVNALDHAIRATKKDNWRGSMIKEREVRYAIAGLVPEDRLDEIFELIKNQRDY